ncbi:MAG: UDP-N-acetylglucosamine--N-acetylmuramyl-(pentapeptide) pyrophosphoryl-undecaprenol N-acetylglucosamine transferase [Candidatus Aegiribacteria sp.]
MRLTIAGGGTGGHISPAIAVAEAFREIRPGTDITFISTPRPVDSRMYAPYGEAVHVMRPPRIDRGLTDMVFFPFRAVREYAAARRLLGRIGPDVLFATGGYPSFFPILAAGSLGIPSAIHESNSVPGRANRVASRFADLVMTGFRSASDRFGGEAVYTGNPVRSSMKRYDRSRARTELGIPKKAPVVLFLGGSQGARALNDMALEVPEGVHLLLQCGSRDLERVRGLSSGIHRVKIFDFIDDPALLYSAADVAVARSGAMTVAELTWFRLPSVYVPYPFAADDHQRGNAREIVRGGGALMADQNSTTGKELWKQVSLLLARPDKLEGMRKKLKTMMEENPAFIIAGKLAEMGSGEGVMNG